MKYLACALAALATGFGVSPASAVVTTLDFSGNICGAAGTGACGDYSQIGQNYGDSAIVDVQYRSITSTGATHEAFLKFWTQYGDLPGIVWGGAARTGYISEIVFLPGAGYEVSLIGLDFATYQQRSATVPFTITALNGTAIYSNTLSTLAPNHNSLALDSAYFASGIRLQWGPDGYDVGLDNIRFDVRAIDTTPRVPEPASWAMMVGGFALVGSALRRRRTTLRFA